jgi:hypothetical protein
MLAYQKERQRLSTNNLVFWLFVAVACGGVLMALLVALRVRFPSFVGVAHGLGGLAALGLLIVANVRGQEATPPLAWWSFGVLLSGFFGGLLLFRVLFRDRIRLPLVAAHASVSATGLYLLYRAFL